MSQTTAHRGLAHANEATNAQVDMMQIWHARTDADRLRRWLRQQLQEVASAQQPVATGTARKPRVRRG